MDTRELYQSMILDHGRHRPRNNHDNPEATSVQTGHNPLCGDKLKIYLVEKGGVIESASFTGEGCAISIASASLMTEAVKNKTRQEVQALFDAFHQAVTESAPDAASQAHISDVLGKLSVLAGVKAYPMRVKCATLAWHTLQGALSHTKTVINTENESALLSFSDSAVDYIKHLINEKPSPHVFRLSLKESGCSAYMYSPELVEQGQGDDHYMLTPQGLSVYVDKKYTDVLRNTRIDLLDKGLGQKQLVFDNPQALDACGCGESFNIKREEEGATS